MLHEVREVYMDKFGRTLLNGAERSSIDMCAEVNLRRQAAGDIPPVMDAPVTAESPVEPISTTDEDSSSIDEEPEAMQVTAGTSTDQPGNIHAGSILPVGEEPMYPPSTTSLHQPIGTDIRTQMVTTGSGPGDFDFRQDPFWARRHHLVTTGSSDTSDSARRALQYFRLLSPRRVTLRLYEAAPIAVQPHPAEMLRNIDDPDHFLFRGALSGSGCDLAQAVFPSAPACGVEQGRGG